MTDAEARVRAVWPGAWIERFEADPDDGSPAGWIVWTPDQIVGFIKSTEAAAWEAAAAALPSDPRSLVLSAHPGAFAFPTSDGWHVFASAVRLLATAATEAGAWGEAARGLGAAVVRSDDPGG